MHRYFIARNIRAVVLNVGFAREFVSRAVVIISYGYIVRKAALYRKSMGFAVIGDGFIGKGYAVFNRRLVNGYLNLFFVGKVR